MAGPLNAYPQIWSFSDSNDVVLNPLSAFRSPFNVRVFQTTSPAEERWKEWTKQCWGVDLYIMDVPSTEEVKDLG